jgi:type I restriction enzyme, R subunit
LGKSRKVQYEGRLAKIELREDEKPKIDPEFDEVTEGQEQEAKEELKTKWARLEAMVGTEKRVNLIARDIVEHWERRQEAMQGKAMVVCMSRRICVDLHNAIVKLRPEWHHDDDDKGAIKVVMTGSAADRLDWQQHIRNKAKREGLAKRLKDPADPLELVIVRDMWLTGFDAPCLHTMYVDKPMRGHGLMQAIARVNRVFKDKPGGLVVDYLGLAEMLKQALAEYSEGDRGETGIPKEQAVEVLLEKFEVVQGMYHGFDYSKFFSGQPAERLAVIPAAMEHILGLTEGKTRYLKAVSDLSKAFALAVPHEQALAVRDDVGFFQTVRSGFVKATPAEGEKTQEDIETAIRQLVSKAVASDQVVDIFAAAGLKKPDISILSDEFLAEVQGMEHRNLALELLRKLLNDEIKARSKKNLVQSRSFAEMLEEAIRAYQNRSLEAAQVIARLIELAKEMREAHKRGEALNLNEEEVAFYDALEVNDSAVQVLGDQTLRTIARELVETVRRNTTIDWTLKESVKAKLRVMVKRILRKYGYPPDKQEKATLTVLEQAELLCRDWAA